ncbi:fatty acid desaturase-domain-containing protein [Multifurca ochricompacta]|uniref:Delta 8-(E)-sphingolipid desaturase n=1 Tax=Multifurca ochricompacta TaxID=376703 RepID=A0AAD4QQE3_9AGAM|nr:fatty acid desaturase-domain-containing protein [Multifurca ochricompacta]
MNTRQSIATRILDGELLFILNGNLICVPQKWLSVHPGGTLTILHFIGRDATDEVEAYHPKHVLKKMLSFSQGPVQLSEGYWVPLLPPIATGWIRKPAPMASPEYYSSENMPHFPPSQVLLVKRADTSLASGPSLASIQPPPTTLSLKIQSQHSTAYKSLHKRILAAGLYQTRYISGYGPEVARYMFFALTSCFLYRHHWFFLSAVSLGALWHQLIFFCHDLGHVGVTHNWYMDRLIAIFLADLIGGLSIGWWLVLVVTNHPSHDPDIQNLPFLVITPAFFKSLYSSYYMRELTFDRFARFVVTVQHRLFYVIMSLGRFNLYRLSYLHLWVTRREPSKARGGRWSWWLEVFALGGFLLWYGKVIHGCGPWQKGLMYLLVSNMVPSPLHVQIVLSHYSRSTADLGPTESFPHRQLRTTTDVVCHPFVEFLHGGLHLQVTHHLFPRLPRHNLKEASYLVKEFAKEQGLEYAEFGFFEGNGEVRSTLRGVADQLKIMKMVADSGIQEAMNGKTK